MGSYYPSSFARSVFWSHPVDRVVTFSQFLFVLPATAKTALVSTLRLLGFSSGGPVSGSFAASWMSSISQHSAHHRSISAAVFSWCQHVSMTVPMFTLSAAIIGVLAGLYYTARYISDDGILQSVVHSGVWGGNDRMPINNDGQRQMEDVEAPLISNRASGHHEDDLIEMEADVRAVE